MTVQWTRRALADVTAVLETISAENPAAADRLEERILKLTGETLREQPLVGRPGRIAGTRELIVTRSYILVYRLRVDRVELLAFRHGARLWPLAF